MQLINNVDQAMEYSRSILADIDDKEVWIIPQSGGKDSRATAQVTLALIADGKIDGPDKIVFYFADTLGEFPSFIDQAKTGIQDLAACATKIGLEVHTFVTMPIPQHDFWVRVLGYGILPPTSGMRWCTDKLKLSPPAKVLRRSEWHHKPQLLGVRYGESDRRDEELKKGEDARILACTATGECGPDYLHFRLSKAVPRFAPIKQWKACAVWDWLTLYAPGYGFNNQALVDHYNMNSWMHDREEAHKNGLDESQGLRYGCWFCPLIFNDTTAKHLRKEQPQLAELMLYVDDHLRRGGQAWQEKNREHIRQLDGDVSDGRLTIGYCKEVYNWLLRFEKRWGQAVFAPWQKKVIEGTMQWRRDAAVSAAGGSTEVLSSTTQLPLVQLVGSGDSDGL